MNSKARKTPGLKTQPPAVTDRATAEAFLRWALAEIGPGYHPDTPFSDYEDRIGMASFTEEEQRLLDERQAQVSLMIDDPCEVILDQIRRLHGRWIVQLETRAGGDYDVKRTADGPGEVAELVQRLLHGEMWSDEDSDDEEPAWDAFCRTCLGCVPEEQLKIEAAFAASFAEMEFEFMDGRLTVTREE